MTVPLTLSGYLIKQHPIIIAPKNKNINVIAQGNNDDERTHSVKLMPMIDNMFKASNLSLDNIDLLACCLGPGSFTGIRI